MTASATVVGTNGSVTITSTTGLVASLAAIAAELPNIGKNDKSPEGYAYRGIEAITKHLQPLLAKHGVVIVPGATVTEVRPSPAMKDGWQDVYMQVDWLICKGDERIEARTSGIGRDRADKGANKAQTQAYKYLLLHLFCVADGKDDSDGQTYEDGHAADVPRLSDTDRALLTEAVKALQEDNRKRVAEWMKTQRMSLARPGMTEDQANRLEEFMNTLTPTEAASDDAV